VLAYLIALITHLLTLGLFVTGVRLLIFGYSDFLRVLTFLGGVICVGLAWVLRPRVGKVPEKDVLAREQAPTLYQLVNRIAEGLGAKPVDYIVIAPMFNASFGRAGWRQKRILALGLPLFASLNDEERVALIGHELAHDVNGDSARGLLVGSAVDSLVGWYVMIRPARIWDAEAGIPGLLMLPLNLITLVVAGFGWVGALVLSHLLWRDSQRAEYFADYLGATAGGTKAMLSMLEKMHSYNSFTTILQRVALTPELREQNLFAMIRERMESVPPLEVERVKRVQQMDSSRLDVTHPPTVYRLDALRSHLIGEPKVRVSAAESAAIQKELAQVEPEIQKKLIELRRAGYFTV
jgi:Zn-dependent protease with chaperone function